MYAVEQHNAICPCDLVAPTGKNDPHGAVDCPNISANFIIPKATH